MSTTRRILLLALAVAAAITASVVALGATPNRILPGQRIDVRVLLISADGTEPGFGAWKAALAREGVPYDTLVSYSGATKAATLTDDRLADYGGNHAKYNAIILASGDLGHNVTNPGATTSFLSAFTDAEWSTLAKFERTFAIRQISDNTAPGPAHGLNTVGGASQDGVVGALTATGRSAFPYLKGPVPMANDDPAVAETFGYAATPVTAANWQTLVSGPNNTAFLGIYTHPDDGREEMVMTVAGNENQSQAQVLRHGMLNWVTRGVFLGYQRNYLELQIDDLFLGDDAWNPATHATSFDPLTASRMTAADLGKAVAWSKANGLRLDFAFNGGGSAQYMTEHSVTSDPLANAFADPTTRNAFGYINHTFDHPNIDCSTASFITKELTDNLAWAQQHSLPLNAAETITGEHSGLANSRPGNPGTIDPPIFDEVTAAAAGGTIPAGTYDYAMTTKSAAGETPASVVPGIVVAANGSVAATTNAVCHATSYQLYRSPAGTNTWTLVRTLTQSPTAPTDNGTAPIVLTLTDTGPSAGAGTPPTTNGAALAPYGQNPNYLSALVSAGIRFTATDASKTYPQTPADVAGAQWPIGATFSESTAGGGFQTFPRYPSNVYYNVSKQSQQLDEYNWIYVAPANGGGCVPITGVTTCRTAAATWADYVNSENTIMFRHLMGNDPRPHFMHQSNLADYNPALPETDLNQGGILYPVVGGLLNRYTTYFDRTAAPLLQPTSSQIAGILAQQDTWAANVAAGRVSAWLQDGKLHVKNATGAAIDVPITGTQVGDMYGGQRSGWVTLPGAAEATYVPNDPATANAPAITGTPRVGSTLSAGNGTWTGSAPIDFGYQWQRCDAQGTGCANIAGASGQTYVPVAADDGARLRVVVSAGNWISSVSQAPSAATAAVTTPAQPVVTGQSGPAGSGGSGGSGTLGTKGSSSGGSTAVGLRLTNVTMSPRRFALAHRVRPKGTRLDGSRITWKLNRAATVRLTFQRAVGSGRHRRWVTVGTVSRAARAGTGTVRFTGRFGSRMLPPRQYRVAVTARSGGTTAGPKRVTFTVVAG